MAVDAATRGRAQAPLNARAPGKRHFWRMAATVLLTAALAGAAVAAFFLFVREDGGTTASLASGVSAAGAKATAQPFRIEYPTTWRPLSKDELAALPGNPLAVLRRDDGKGFLVIRAERGQPASNLAAFSRDLRGELQRRVPDFQPRSSKTVKVRAGNAHFSSYIRKRTGTVHTVVVVPAGTRTYTLNTVSRGGSDDVAREIARMILSFDV